MKSNIMPTFLLALLVACSLGKAQVETFTITAEELIALTKNTEFQSQNFIEKWGLDNCSDGSGVSYFCLNSDMITFEQTEDGYIISLTNIPFENYEVLIAELAKTHKTKSKEEILESSEFIRKLNIAELVMYYQEDYDFIIGKNTSEGIESYAIFGSSKYSN